MFTLTWIVLTFEGSKVINCLPKSLYSSFKVLTFTHFFDNSVTAVAADFRAFKLLSLTVIFWIFCRTSWRLPASFFSEALKVFHNSSIDFFCSSNTPFFALRTSWTSWIFSVISSTSFEIETLCPALVIVIGHVLEQEWLSESSVCSNFLVWHWQRMFFRSGSIA